MATVSLRLHKKGVGMFLSPLEEQILRILWKKKTARVRDIHAHLKTRTALTSVAVSLDRLHTRKAVGRKVEPGQGGPHYVYYSLDSKDGFERSLIDSAVNTLIGSFGDVAVNYFNDRFGKRESDD
ncbi:MAG: BlaI/MecI/CopY family transcriptional regulator [Candidatus Aenigmarchaeota archaeon]|nr:BlaI/MecI/CopY family transcriptional regulator [Candidatus Aenigmarchaeota archaeon]